VPVGWNSSTITEVLEEISKAGPIQEQLRVVIQEVHRVGDLHSRLLQATFQNPVVSLGLIQLAGQFFDLPLEAALVLGVLSNQLLDIFARVPDGDVLLFQNFSDLLGPVLRLELDGIL
jgi:hypothetical protein